MLHSSVDRITLNKNKFDTVELSTNQNRLYILINKIYIFEKIPAP